MADKTISALTAATTPLAGTEVLPIVQGGVTVKVSVNNLTAGKAVSGLNFTVTGATIPTNGVYLPAANTVGISTNSVGNVFVTSAGRLGVGSVNPSNQISATDSTLSVISLDWLGDNNAKAAISANHGTGEVRYTAVANYFPTFYSNNLERMRISTAGDISAVTGNLVVGTAGKGIDFSANGGDVLTQYDEGTWTVVWTNLTGTPSNTTGYYTRIGRLVFFTYAAGINSISGTGGVVKFSLPFTPANYAAGSMIAQNNTNAGSVLIDTSAVAYPQTFNGVYMVFSGTFYI